MADGLSVYLAKKLFDSVFGNTAYSVPATTYFAAFTTMPTDRSGAGAVEVSGNGYSRQAVTNNTTNFISATGSTAAAKTTGAAVTWPTASGGNWGTILGWGVYDASSGGNPLYWGTFTASQVINNGDTLQFNAGGPVLNG